MLNNNGISFPDAPWTLVGKGLQSFFFTATARLKHLVPGDLEIVNVIPGYTLSMLSAGTYNESSSLKYNELIVSPALVKNNEKIGFWISNIYVDSLSSQKGGTDIWKLNKEIVQFSWTTNYSHIVVNQNNAHLLTMSINKSVKIPLPALTIRAFSSSNDWLSSFVGKANMRSRIGVSSISYGPDCPFSYLKTKKGLGLLHHQGKMIAHKPDVLISKRS